VVSQCYWLPRLAKEESYKRSDADYDGSDVEYLSKASRCGDPYSVESPYSLTSPTFGH
jgi:hypothetical protein